MNIKNQKNGRQRHIIHQEALTNGKPCPIRALTEQVHHILSNCGSNDYRIVVVYTNGTKSVIYPLQTSITVKAYVCALGLEKQDIMTHNEHQKSEEWAPETYHSPRGPHKRKTMPHQSADGTSPPHLEQLWEQ